MWLRGDNCTLNILFVLQLVLTRWPPMYDPVFRCTVCTACTVIVQCMGPVPQSARDNQPVQISADISAKRSTTSLWWVQDDFNNKENSDIDMWLKRSKCWLFWVICSRIKQRLLGHVKWSQDSKHNALHISFLWKPHRDPWIWLQRPWRSHASPPCEVLRVASSECGPWTSSLAEAALQAQEIL